MEICVYCDESCHLERDGQRAMVLGAVWCPKSSLREITIRLKEIKMKHGLNPYSFEMKWSKVSPAKVAFYREVLEYFLSNDDLHFRALIVPDKSKLDHQAFSQDHDTWYYKMFFNTLKVLFYPGNSYNLYFDFKDANSYHRCQRLGDILRTELRDPTMIQRVQPVRSHELETLQLTDLLTGLVSYKNRELSDSATKKTLVEMLVERTGYKLNETTWIKSREAKINLLRWEANHGR